MAGEQATRDSPGDKDRPVDQASSKNQPGSERGPFRRLTRSISTVPTILAFQTEETKGLWGTQAKETLRAFPELWYHGPQGAGERGVIP